MTSSEEKLNPTSKRRWTDLLFVLLLAWILSPALKGLYYKSVAPSVPAGQSVSWGLDLSEALARSAQKGKPVLLVFTASWCPPCQVMKHEVWTDPAVRKLAETSYQPVLLDVDLEESRPAAQRYRVESIPTILVLDSKGEVQRHASSMSVSATLEFLEGTD